MNQLKLRDEHPPAIIELDGERLAQMDKNALGFARALAALAHRRNMVIVGQGGDQFLRVRAWQMLAHMLNLAVVEVSNERDEHGTWTACCELQDETGRTVSRATAICSRSEEKWAERNDFELRSMAASRALSHASRQRFGFLAEAAGFKGDETDAAAAGARSAARANANQSVASPKQVKLIEHRAYKNHINAGRLTNEACRRYGIERLDQLPRSAVDEMLQWCDAGGPDDDGVIEGEAQATPADFDDDIPF
ncbi:MAG: hypothetical protein ACR2RL_25090 [Gammaproteobacteria bacterium]